LDSENNKMTWLEQSVETLAARPVCGYRHEEKPAVEPTALSARALLSAKKEREARIALDWLSDVQSVEGSLGINAERSEPCWPTGWAILAWIAAAKHFPDTKAKWTNAANRAVEWLLTHRGKSLEFAETQEKYVHHDTKLRGWPWVYGTHSWVEPTAINLLALRGAERTDHPSYREAVRMLLDRQLPGGGWSCGNTVVLDNVQRPHVQPTGLALAALALEKDIGKTIQPSIDWLNRVLSRTVTVSSLCYALLGLAGYGIRPDSAETWLEAAHQKTMQRGGSPYHLALLVLAENRVI
jgi:hypothetical protein